MCQPAGLAELARRTGRSEAAVRSLIASARDKLKAARDERPRPFVDRTRYTAWNAMMTSALLQAGAVLDDEWAHRHALATLALLRREGEADAVLHTPGGTPVTVSVRRDGDSAVLEVADRGPGVPAELRTRVFEPANSALPPCS